MKIDFRGQSKDNLIFCTGKRYDKKCTMPTTPLQFLTLTARF